MSEDENKLIEMAIGLADLPHRPSLAQLLWECGKIRAQARIVREQRKKTRGRLIPSPANAPA